MKTLAVVLCALLATAAPAFAHGGDGGGGGPVMSGSPIQTGFPIHTGFPIQAGFPTQGGFPIISRPEPDRKMMPDPKRKERAALIDYGDLCTAAISVPAIYQRYQVKGGPPCPVQTQNGMLALPPAFSW
ncbi:MAG TPA: hypothetical protein VGG89_12635 [Candidatus Baltobacteraceae bacterium]|jgi:hypothetical protein